MKKFIALLLIAPAFGFYSLPANLLKGKVYDEQRNPVKNISIRFASIGTAVTTNSGEFIIEIPDGQNSAEIELTDRNWSILYPIDKKIAVTSDPDYITKIVITKASSASLNIEDIVEKYVRLENVLKDIGLAQNDLNTLLRDFIKKESAETNLAEENLKSAIYKEKRTERFASISSAMLKYLLKTQNIKSGFRVVTDFAFENRNALNELVNIINEYNLAFNEVNNNRFAYNSDIILFWNNKDLSKELYEICNYALEEIHKPYILSLNDEVAEINKLPSSHYEEDEKENIKKKIIEEINYSLRELEIKLPVLERRINETLLKLQQDI